MDVYYVVNMPKYHSIRFIERIKIWLDICYG